MWPNDPPDRGWNEYLRRLTPLGIAGVYVVFGVVLLVASDLLLPALIEESALLHRAQAVKGAVEVFVGAGVIYLLVDGSQQELRLKTRAMDEASIGIIMTDPDREDNPIVYVNEGFERITGYSESELLDENCRVLQGPDTDPEAVERLAEAIDEERSATVEIENYRKDGTPFWNEVTVTPIKDVEGNVTHFLGFQRDVTDRKRRERALETSEVRFEALVEHFPNGGVFLFDEENRYTVVGGADLGEVGLTAENIQGKTPDEVFPPDLAETLTEKNRAALAGEENVFEVEYQGQTYQVRTVPLTDGDGEVFAGLCVARNITEREERERELRHREQTYRNLVESSPAPIDLIDEEGEIVWGNEAAVELLGLEDAADLCGRSIYEFVHPDDHEAATEELDRVLEGDETVGPTDFTIVREDDEVRYIRTNMTAGWYEGERVAQAVVNDVTTLRETQEELRQNERRYRTLVELSPEPIIVHVDGEIVYANDAFVDQVGAEGVESVLGSHINDYLDPAEHEDAIETARQTQAGDQEPTNYRRTMQTLDGTAREITTRSRSIPYEGESAVLTIVTDRTEEFRYRQALETLHEHTREMYRGETVETVADAGASAAADLLDLPGATVYAMDESDHELRPISRSGLLADRLGDPAPIVPDDESTGWQAFVEGNIQYVSNGQVETEPENPFRSRLFVPLGTDGLLVTGSIENAELSEFTVELCSILGANLAEALDRVEQAAALETRDDELERKTVALGELEHLIDVVQGVHRSLVDSSTREAIETAIPQQLADRDEYAAAWLGRPGEDGRRVVTETTAGTMDGLADEIRDASSTHPVQSLAIDAIETGAARCVSNVLEDDEWADHRQTALAYGYRSVLAVPVPVDRASDRVLVIHAPEPDAFSDRSVDVFEGLGRLVAMAMDALGESRPQLTGSTTEVDLEIRDTRLLLNRLSTEFDAPITLQGAIPVGDGQFLGFVETSLDPETVEEAVAGVSAVEAIEHLASNDDSNFYRVTASASPFLEVVYEYDAQLTAIAAADGTATVTVQVDASRSVREFVEELQDAYPETTLLARRSIDDVAETPLTFHERVRQTCTDRQYQALQAAYFGGYYEWPRAATNEDLAAGLDISSPTYQSHRRAAERIVVSTLFEPQM
jgi:PAS domain S-box-containing protein